MSIDNVNTGLRRRRLCTGFHQQLIEGARRQQGGQTGRLGVAAVSMGLTAGRKRSDSGTGNGSIRVSQRSSIPIKSQDFQVRNFHDVNRVPGIEPSSVCRGNRLNSHWAHPERGDADDALNAGVGAGAGAELEPGKASERSQRTSSRRRAEPVRISAAVACISATVRSLKFLH
jgi:hypothetical protein